MSNDRHLEIFKSLLSENNPEEFLRLLDQCDETICKIVDKNRRNILMIVANKQYPFSNKYPSVLKYLLESNILTPKLINMRDIKGQTFMHYACKNEQPNLVKDLLEFEKITPSLLAVQDVNGRTCMHYACKYFHTDALKHLLASNKVTNELLCIRDFEGYTCLHVACGNNGQIGSIELLLNSGKLTKELILANDNSLKWTCIFLARDNCGDEIAERLNEYII